MAVVGIPSVRVIKWENLHLDRLGPSPCKRLKHEFREVMQNFVDEWAARGRSMNFLENRSFRAREGGKEFYWNTYNITKSNHLMVYPGGVTRYFGQGPYMMSADENGEPYVDFSDALELAQ